MKRIIWIHLEVPALHVHPWCANAHKCLELTLEMEMNQWTDFLIQLQDNIMGKGGKGSQIVGER